MREDRLVGLARNGRGGSWQTVRAGKRSVAGRNSTSGGEGRGFRGFISRERCRRGWNHIIDRGVCRGRGGRR